jgi:hypothetical protein
LHELGGCVLAYNQPPSRRRDADWDDRDATHWPEKLQDGKFAASKLSATCVFDRHESIALMGELQGEKLVGTFRTEGRDGKWEATRAAKASAGL